MNTATILIGDVRERLAELPDCSVQCVVTSPPYWGLRDYGHDGQLGLEHTPDEYVDEMVKVFAEVKRVLKDDGVLWLNLGDSYAQTSKGSGGTNSFQKTNSPGSFHDHNNWKIPNGLKPKDLVGIPWRVAFALQADGWWLRQDIIWHKPNPMPESVTDRCTKAHEYVFMLTKSSRYYYDNQAVLEPFANGGEWLGRLPNTDRIKAGGNPNRADKGARPTTGFVGGRNRRSVWTIATKPFKGAHFAVMPEALCKPPIMATSKPGDLVLDPFTGSGTVAVVALRHGRNFVGCELNFEYAKIAEARISGDQPMMNQVEIETSSSK